MNTRLALVAVAAAVAGSSLVTAPASAAVRFDPVTNTGFVDGEDVRKAFGWDAENLRRNAPEVGFTYHVGKEEIFSVLCDHDVRFGVGHNPGSTSARLTSVVTVDLATGGLSGFRITGVSSGASSIDTLPEVGRPCPDQRGQVVRRVTHVRTTTTEALSAEFGDVQVYLTQKRAVSTTP
jgi:hypothetical protein